MLKGFTLFGAAGLIALASPAAAEHHDEPEVVIDTSENVDMDEAKLAEFSQMISGLFQAEPLTQAQEARLPAASAVVGTIMPEGFYGKLMSQVMESTMKPIFGMFGGPNMILQSKLGLDEDEIGALSEAQQREVALMLDPVFETRGEAMMGAMTGMMGDMFSVMEQPMRDGLSRAYAVRFDNDQLADISTFFATPTGQLYATESMALFSDPQVMSAVMSTMPLMMQGFGNMEETMKTAMADLPAERSFTDLSADEKTRVAKAVGKTVAELEEHAALTTMAAEDESEDDAENAEAWDD